MEPNTLHSPAPSTLAAIRGSRSTSAVVGLLTLAPAAGDEALDGVTMLAEHPHPLGEVA
ncbi:MULTISPECIES: hypothetical protein [unclassified Streptomyces]|uniref:hypothetical protein n=1 Tax=unclassified Streptomyces TaxID=2593676 RepID=UPI002E17FC75